jgi:outer membrane autotransporter protein
VTVSGSLPSTPVALSKTRYTILTATNGVSGKFASVSGLPSFSFLTGGLTYGANDVTLGYSFATPFSLAAKNINQRNVGNALTLAALGPVNALGAPILNALFLGNYANAQAVMDTVSGSGLAGVQSTAMQVGQMASSAVSDQIAFWRSGETQDATGITSQEGNNPRNYMAYAPVGANVAAKGPIRLNTKGDLVAAVAPRTFRAWGSMFGGGANFQTDAGRGAAASTAGFYGGLMGLDYQLTPNLLIGVALGGSSASFSVGSLSTTGALTGFHAGLYGAYTMGASYVALNETFSAWDNQTSRKAGGYATLPYEQLTAGFGSTEFRTRLEAGHGVPVAGIKATPFIAAEIAAYQTNGFTERSSAVASSFALKNNGQAINSLPTFVGVRLSDAFTLANGWRLAPVGSVAYVHEFFPQRQFTNILLSMPGAEFNVSGPRSTFNLVQTKLGAQLNLTNQLALYSDFQGEFSYVSQSYGGKAGMKYWW